MCLTACRSESDQHAVSELDVAGTYLGQLALGAFHIDHPRLDLDLDALRNDERLVGVDLLHDAGVGWVEERGGGRRLSLERCSSLQARGCSDGRARGADEIR